MTTAYSPRSFSCMDSLWWCLMDDQSTPNTNPQLRQPRGFWKDWAPFYLLLHLMPWWYCRVPPFTIIMHTVSYINGIKNLFTDTVSAKVKKWAKNVLVRTRYVFQSGSRLLAKFVHDSVTVLAEYSFVQVIVFISIHNLHKLQSSFPTHTQN